MKYQLFDTLAAAQAYADLKAEALPRGINDTTMIWDIPKQLVDGRFVVCAHDAGGQDWQTDWQLKT